MATFEIVTASPDERAMLPCPDRHEAVSYVLRNRDAPHPEHAVSPPMLPGSIVHLIRLGDEVIGVDVEVCSDCGREYPSEGSEQAR